MAGEGERRADVSERCYGCHVGRTTFAVARLGPVILVVACSGHSSTGGGTPDAQSDNAVPEATGSDGGEADSGTDAAQSMADASGSACAMAGGQCLSASSASSCGKLGSEACPSTQAGSYCCLEPQ